MKPDYSWQRRCIDKVLTAVADGKRDFLVNATPGAGKTQMTADLAAQMVIAGMIDFVVVVVPTSTIRDHFVEDMAGAGITLARIEDGGDFARMKAEGIGKLVEGFCMTTGMLIGYARDIGYLIERSRVLFVSDEAHHNGTGLRWGDKALEVSYNAVLRLGLSGTPYRSDNAEIPFLHYEQGVGVPHFEFTFAEAREAGLITAVNFRAVSGYVDVLDTEVSNDALRYDYDVVFGEEDEARRLRYSLDYRSPYVQKLLAAADEELQLVRQTQSDAAGIVFANTTRQAKTITRYLRNILGRKVRLVVEGANASEEINGRIDKDGTVVKVGFNDSDEEWIVQIRKVYEGANIPRLRVGAYLTNWTTEGFFDQASKRLVRRIPGVNPDDMPAIMFMPKDPTLESIASGLGNVKPHDLNTTKDFKYMDVTGGADHDDGPPFHFQILGGTGHVSSAIIDGKTYSAEDVAEAEAFFADDPEVKGQPSITKMMYFAALKRRGVA